METVVLNQALQTKSDGAQDQKGRDVGRVFVFLIFLSFFIFFHPFLDFFHLVVHSRETFSKMSASRWRRCEGVAVAVTATRQQCWLRPAMPAVCARSHLIGFTTLDTRFAKVQWKPACLTPAVSRRLLTTRVRSEEESNIVDAGPRLMLVRETDEGLEVQFEDDDNILSFFHYEWLHRYPDCALRVCS